MTSFVLVAGIASAAFDASRQPDAPAHAKPRLITENKSLVSGDTAWLGITFDIDDEWHIYWDGAGDTGQPVKAEFTLPQGYKVGEIVWPTPKRYIVADFALDYIYERSVTLLVPLYVPKDAKPGDVAAIRAKVSWMECSEECRPGSAVVAIHVPVAASASVTKSPESSRFEETRRRTPRPVEETAQAVRFSWDRDTLTMNVPSATKLIFYPHRTSAALTDPMSQGEATSDRIAIQIDADSENRVVGILEAVQPDAKGKSRSDYYQIDIPRSASAAAEPPGKSAGKPE